MPRQFGTVFSGALTTGALLIAGGGEAAAHATAENGTATWPAWAASLPVTLGVLVAALVYLRGLLREHGGRRLEWRSLAFFSGLLALLLALQSPLDRWAERLFVAHQAQHLLLRMIAPMLMILAAPQGRLLRGLPGPIRRNVVWPAARFGWMRAGMAVLLHPVCATLLFVASLAFWQMPDYHELALRRDSVHYLMHMTMLGAGLAFWWCVLDRRPPPAGCRYGVRMMMIWLALLANIVIGAYLAFKGTILYPAYEATGRLLGLGALADEQLGGATIWIPGSMMFVLAALLVIHAWGRNEARTTPKDVSPGPAADRRRHASRAMALGFLAFVATVFGAAILIGILRRNLGT